MWKILRHFIGGKSGVQKKKKKSALRSEIMKWALHESRPKLPPGALLAIIDDFLMDIYTIWLRLKDICRLDSAVCAKWLRPNFLRLVSAKVMLFLREKIDVLDHKSLTTTTHEALRLPALNWILKRGIHLATLRLPRIGDISISEQECICAVLPSILNIGLLEKVEVINFKGCDYLSYRDISSEIIDQSSKSLKSIEITGIDFIVFPKNILCCERLEAFASTSEQSIVAVIGSCKKLRKLVCLYGDMLSDMLSDMTMQSLQVHGRQLEHVFLGRCTAVSDAAIRNLVELCPRLKVFGIEESKISDMTIISLSKSCPFLESVHIGRNHQLTDTAVMAIAERLPGLTHIGLNLLHNISRESVEKLAGKCKLLRYINLDLNNRVNDITLMNIADNCSTLKEVSVYLCPNVTGVGLGYLVAKCSKLENVRTSNYEAIGSLSQLAPRVTCTF
jgi:hypothetical protein